MKKIFLTVVLIATVLMSGFSAPRAERATGSATMPSGEITNGLTGKSWQLTEIRINGVNTGFNRNDLTKIGLTAAEGFTLNFDAETVNGLGAPNRYVAPYTLTDNQISISLMAATKMASFLELDKLKEQEYFDYLQKADSWNIVNNNLELSSKTTDGKAAILIFSPVSPER
jgi:heat shock protein HslJ